MSSMTHSATLAVIDVERCRELLRHGSVGRVAVVVDGVPHIIPVNYGYDGKAVVFRTEPGTVVSEVPLTHVAFEIDHIDETSQSGWSVAVHGYGREITDTVDKETIARRGLPFAPWASGVSRDRNQWFEILVRDISGRRLVW